MRGMKSNPCKDCQARQVGCHAGCERYIAAHEQHVRESKAINNARQETNMMDAYYKAKKMRIPRKERW